jgi:hypothetical protein
MIAPVEMTKGRTALPATVVAEQDPFFIALTSPAGMTRGEGLRSRRLATRMDRVENG